MLSSKPKLPSLLVVLIRDRLHPEAKNDLGKSDDKVGIKLKIGLNPEGRLGLDMEDLEDMFKRIGKGIHYDYVVRAKVQ